MLFLETLYDYLLLSAPFLLFGFFVAGLIHTYLSLKSLKSLDKKGKFSSVFKASLIGIPFPLCSCGVIPAAVELKKSKLNNGATSAFLISTPETGIDSIAMTYAMMDIPMTILRPIIAFVTASFAGIMQILFNDEESNIKDSVSCSKPSTVARSSLTEKVKNSISYVVGPLINDIALWLGIGLLVGASIEHFILGPVFLDVDPWVSRLLVILIGTPLYICAQATTPIAASLVMKGMSPGVALMLLILGPATNASNIFVLQKYIGKKGVLINVASIIVVSLVLSFAVDFLYEYFAFPINFKVEGSHQINYSWWHHLSVVVLVGLILKGIWKNHLQKKFSFS